MKIELYRKDKYFAEYSTDATIDSKYGEITCEVAFDVDELDDLPNDTEIRAQKIVDAVTLNTDAMCQKIYQSYLMYCDNSDWMEGHNVPVGLAFDDVKKYVGALTMRIMLYKDPSEDEFSISAGDGWDCEHGLYVTLEGDSWEFTDC